MHLTDAGGIMAERQEGQTPERYEETRDPRNPPNSVANRNVRRTALRVYLGPLIALFIVAGLALIYWANRGPVRSAPRDGVGTTGNDVVGERGNASDTPGGFNPDPRPGSTEDELKFRGVDDAAAAGGALELRDVRVVGVRDGGRTFWVENDGDQIEVMAPENGPAVKAGATVSVTGVRESNGQGGTRVRANRVTVD
jgi:hypothetical protein